MEEHFNSYKTDINLDFLRQYCINNGTIHIFKRGTIFQQLNMPQPYWLHPDWMLKIYSS